MVTRVPVLDVRPQLEGGRFAVKAVVDDDVVVTARVLGDAHRVVRAAVVLTGPDGVDRRPVPMERRDDGLWSATVSADRVGAWTFSVQSWHDPLAAWAADARRRLGSGRAVEETLAQGAALVARAHTVDVVALDVADELLDQAASPVERLATALSFVEGLPADAVRDHADATSPLPLLVERELALAGSWYRLVPRSEGAVVDPDGTVRPGTLTTAAKRLEAVAAMGFDVVALAPVHPVGRTGRRGPDGIAPAGPHDPGSPWAVGSAAGGHDALDPGLGTLDDLDAFLVRARQLGLEVALDLALQCSPDHPWVADHPEWVRLDLDAEDPEVLPLDVDADPAGLYLAVLDVVLTWVDRGIRAFVLHRPERIPLAFWERLVADVRAHEPHVVLVAEPRHDESDAALQRHALGLAGFSLATVPLAASAGVQPTAALLDEATRREVDALRPALFVNAVDDLPADLRGAQPYAFALRAALAALAAPTWGLAAGFELAENDERTPETHTVRIRPWDTEPGLAPFVTRLHEIRRAHPALRRLRNLTQHHVDHVGVLAFSRRLGDDLVLVVADLRPAFGKRVGVHVGPRELGLPGGTSLRFRDELDGTEHDVTSITLDTEAPVRVLVPRLPRG